VFNAGLLDVACAMPRQQTGWALAAYKPKMQLREHIKKIHLLETTSAQDSFQASDMLDVVLPAIGFGIAAIGVLVTVRNGIDLILRDKTHVESSVMTDLVLVGTEITVLEDSLELWKKLWSIFNGVPQSQLITFWGDSGASLILRLLGTTELISKDIEKQFESMYGGVREAARNRLLKSELLEQDEPTSERHRQKMTKRLRAEYDEHVKLSKKIKLALFEAPTFQHHLQTLKTSIDGLQKLSIIEFEKNNDFKYDEEAARELGLQSILLDFTEKIAQPISKLFIWCKQQSLPKTMAIDLQLDLAYGCRMEPRNKFLAQRAAHDGYPYYLRLPNDASVEDGYLQVVLESEAEYSNLDQLVHQLAREPYTDEDEHNAASQPTQSSESLRTILLKSAKNLVVSEYHPFSRRERYKLAYELSEVSMVLLASTSLCELCVCAIRRFCHDAAIQDHEHLIRIKNAHELESSSQKIEDPDRWCKKELRNMHILRLGIVLVEVSTGGVVKDAKYDLQSREVKMTLEIAGYPPEELKDCTPDKVADFVKAAGGEDFSWAVHYCLRRGVTPEIVVKKDVLLFYHNVVAP
jgi:hypothetical protein